MNLNLNPNSSGDNVQATNADRYDDAASSRLVCFVTDVECIGLYYHYLIAVVYKKGENNIILTFTTHEVTLQGSKLRSLQLDFLQQRIREINVIDSRYDALNDGKVPVVHSITVRDLSKQ